MAARGVELRTRQHIAEELTLQLREPWAWIVGRQRPRRRLGRIAQEVVVDELDRSARQAEEALVGGKRAAGHPLPHLPESGCRVLLEADPRVGGEHAGGERG